jgi:hypothetical protein
VYISAFFLLLYSFYFFITRVASFLALMHSSLAIRQRLNEWEREVNVYTEILNVWTFINLPSATN